SGDIEIASDPKPCGDGACVEVAIPGWRDYSTTATWDGRVFRLHGRLISARPPAEWGDTEMNHIASTYLAMGVDYNQHRLSKKHSQFNRQLSKITYWRADGDTSIGQIESFAVQMLNKFPDDADVINRALADAKKRHAEYELYRDVVARYTAAILAYKTAVNEYETAVDEVLEAMRDEGMFDDMFVWRISYPLNGDTAVYEKSQNVAVAEPDADGWWLSVNGEMVKFFAPTRLTFLGKMPPDKAGVNPEQLGETGTWVCINPHKRNDAHVSRLLSALPKRPAMPSIYEYWPSGYNYLNDKRPDAVEKAVVKKVLG
ncbi:MAG: hypothetical protein D6706_13565, partial [Chloroflexi bacterium]